jgi:hypothetical protein
MRWGLFLCLVMCGRSEPAPGTVSPAQGGDDDDRHVDSSPRDAAVTSDAVVEASADGGVEPNGVRQLYPTRTDKAAPWVLGFGDWQTRTRQWGTVTGTGKDTVVKAGGQVRLTVKALPDECEGDTDQGRALQRGYMCSPSDWYNYELTGYVRVDTPAQAEGDQDITFFGGGGRHPAPGGAPSGCTGSSYKGSYDYKRAQVRFSKESWHVNYDFRPWKAAPGGFDLTAEKERWLGIKVVKYEFAQGAKKGIRNELWIDSGGVDASGAPANAWVRAVVEDDHSASWGEQARQCNAPADDQIMLWGGPWVTFRWDNTTASIRLMSVREIIPPS